MHQTSKQINLFDLHDSPVVAIICGEGTIQLKLEFACIGRGHPSNPFEKAQTIKPCELMFYGVKNQVAQVWNEVERVFKQHPEPHNPIKDEIVEFEAIESGNEIKIKLTGFHRAGWAEWQFTCGSVSASWSEFASNAWYES